MNCILYVFTGEEIAVTRFAPDRPVQFKIGFEVDSDIFLCGLSLALNRLARVTLDLRVTEIGRVNDEKVIFRSSYTVTNQTDSDSVKILFQRPVMLRRYESLGTYYQILASNIKGSGSAPQVKSPWHNRNCTIIRDGADSEGKFVKPVKFTIHGSDGNHGYTELFYHTIRP